MAKHPESTQLQNRIIKRLYFRKNQSCAELSQWLKKSVPVVTKVLNELIDERYVVTTGYAPSTGGRRPLSYSLKADGGYILAVAMDQLFTRMVVKDLSGGQVTEPETIELNLHQRSDALQVLSDAMKAHLDRSGVDMARVLGAGVGMPGFINVQEGINYTFFEQHGKTGHRSYLEKALGIPVYIDNDSSLTALAEWTFGEARGHRNALIINIGWGTGLGMIINGELFRGDSGYAGEFSHIPLSDNGVLCECGKRGCLETETSLLIMAQKALEEIRRRKIRHLDVREEPYMSDVIMEAAGKGDQFCIELLSQLGSMLGKGIAILIHVLNPELIVLSGRGAKAEKILMAPVQQALTRYCIPRLAEHTTITISRLGLDAGLIGAAALVMEHTNWYHKARELTLPS